MENTQKNSWRNKILLCCREIIFLPHTAVTIAYCKPREGPNNAKSGKAKITYMKIMDKEYAEPVAESFAYLVVKQK